MTEVFRAFRVHHDEQGFRTEIDQLTPADLPQGDVKIRVHYSGVNYKDGLASIPEGKIVKSYPFTPGIDLAGEVVTSKDPRYQAGDKVICTGFELGVSHPGGYAEYASVPGDWLVKLPEGLDLREAMAIGTAGFTAALSIDRLLLTGLNPQAGPVLVGGATGGVGSVAVSILSRLGYEVTAVTGKSEQTAWLQELGAARVVSRDEAVQNTKGALGSQQWAAVVDPVGGIFTAALLKTIRYGGSIALSGMVGGGKLETSVYPFILRGVHLLGIDSVYCEMELRERLWTLLAGDWKPLSLLKKGITTFTMDELPEALMGILGGHSIGRQVIKLM
ncbi:oxidoreductase [Paenibacillus sp. CAA11]|uniref:acrylyl-CoA reductase family protein n=1 Tax=Paenibacillus sp. CAA11 TaxID=1532905 RepID=UPI000D3B3E7E|nr:acryloyl-CoA reductase [Paenibacillus sp. CAA11]AWB44387.1 oxidoreductase [Paenibacillus sp. CAA11]